MQFALFQSHLDLAHYYWQKLIKPGDIVIDATCGNGQDTLFLAKLQPKILYGFDIQALALESTGRRLKELTAAQISSVKLIQSCHSSFPEEILPSSVKLIVYNLGYLPGGNKTIVTNSFTTLQSIQQALPLLLPGGLISITCYPGHAEGATEQNVLENFVNQLEKSSWSVSQHSWLNRKKAPSLLLLQKTSRLRQLHNRE